ncbi:hypothetical protein OD91_0675 [Lutibacter sp. Hel_I_33_5]|uniref:hypothetical protein n=1 Tax=Lutibacter sp. Hel_I_33_5 TaxID=1566289 RepID=UPI0011A9A9FF|nr:hypothetical protein [Lutibacter sp. Hel_I_33_5]TVZ55427.1 hypothetical protein OD91_0675 [Lutibacter sp. Hel_I_33_5]
MKNLFFSILFIGIMTTINSQTKLPYYEIPEAPKEFTAGSVASRMVDGLGFRYYWATEGLTEKDLKFQPNKDARTTKETLKHIYDLTTVIINAVLEKPNTGKKVPEMSFSEMRKNTLLNIEKSSAILRDSKDISKYKIIFIRGEKTTAYPFWNQINGPISDAIWHVGQVVSFRRSSGNPFPKGVSVLRGKKSD